MTSIVVGQPFDTVKVRLQTSTTFKSSFEVLRHAAKSEQGLVGSLFAGMTPPLVTATIVNAIVFSVYGWSSRVVDRFAEDYRDEYRSSHPRGNQLSYPYSLVPSSLAPALLSNKDENKTLDFLKNFTCGSFAGLVQCLVICPTEHIKCRLQAQTCPNYQVRS